MDAALEPVGRSLAISCECANRRCVEVLHIERDEYAEVRRSPRHFAVVPGHVYRNVEDVVKRSEAYVVVEKSAAAAEVAEELDADAKTTDV